MTAKKRGIVSSKGGQMQGLFFLASWLLLSSTSTSPVRVLARSDDNDGSSASETEEKQCSIYMAKSSLKGHTGFGVYTTRDIARGDPILSGPPGTPDGPTVAVVNSQQNVPLHLALASHQLHNSFGHYWWGRGVPDHVAFESDRGDYVDYQITFGALPNHHCVLHGIDHVYPENPYDDAMLDRYSDPGAGAFSYHRGRIFVATRRITGGSELFLSYGYCEKIEPGSFSSARLWYPTWARDLPMREHYSDTTRALRKLWHSLLEEYGGVDRLPLDMELEPAPDLEPQMAKLIPRSVGQLKRIMEKPSLLVSEDLLQRSLAEEMLTEPRTVEWIRANGMCVEHLIPGRSTIRQAGQGGFAQHRIRKGEMVVPAPLLQVTNRDILTVYNDQEQPDGTQLLLNYCFGHKDTSILLCPDTNAILVNHCSSRTKECGPNGPNAKFQWASGWDPDTPTWMNMTVDEIAKEDGRGLSMEIVALRDIAPGEEVFMDYGNEWEEAWRAHVQAWKPPQGDDYTSVMELNNNPHALDTFVSHDLRSETNHPSLFTACAFYPTEADEHPVWNTPEGSIDYAAMTDKELMEKFSDDGSEYVQDYLTHGDGTYWPCALLQEEWEDEKERGKGPPSSYVVRIAQRYDSEYGEMPWTENSIPRFLYNFPRKSIRIFPKPLHSDQHLKGAFRHYIPLRDEMVPEVWKNLKSVGSKPHKKRIVHWVDEDDGDESNL